MRDIVPGNMRKAAATEKRFRTLEACVRYLTDQLALYRLVASYAPAVDSGAISEAANLWIEDGIYDVDVGTWTGRLEIADMAKESARRSAIEGRGHVISMPLIAINGDEAVGTCYSRLYVKADSGYLAWRIAANRWEFIRTEPGWRLERRVNRLLDGSCAARALLAAAFGAGHAKPAEKISRHFRERGMIEYDDRLSRLENTVRELSDQLELYRLTASYAPAVDSGSAEVTANLWAEGGEYDVDVDVGVWSGREAIAGMVEAALHQSLIKDGCAHVISMPQVTLTGDTAVGICYSRLYVKGANGFKTWRVAANRWEFVRTSEGWRIKRRINRLLDGSEAARALLRIEAEDVSTNPIPL